MSPLAGTVDAMTVMVCDPEGDWAAAKTDRRHNRAKTLPGWRVQNRLVRCICPPGNSEVVAGSDRVTPRFAVGNEFHVTAEVKKFSSTDEDVIKEQRGRCHGIVNELLPSCVFEASNPSPLGLSAGGCEDLSAVVGRLQP